MGNLILILLLVFVSGSVGYVLGYLKSYNKFNKPKNVLKNKPNMYRDYEFIKRSIESSYDRKHSKVNRKLTSFFRDKYSDMSGDGSRELYERLYKLWQNICLGGNFKITKEEHLSKLKREKRDSKLNKVIDNIEKSSF